MLQISTKGKLVKLLTRRYSGVVQQQNKLPIKLKAARPLIVACPPMKSNINISAMARVSSCMGASRLILCGTSKLWPHISRQGLDSEEDAVAFDDAKSKDLQSAKLHGMDVTLHRSLLPVLQKLKRDEGYSIVGVEQTSNSASSYDFKWPHRTVVVVGHESKGISQEILDICDHTVEIPLYGLPFSLNVSHALSIALSGYCQQFPSGSSRSKIIVNYGKFFWKSFDRTRTKVEDNFKTRIFRSSSPSFQYSIGP